MFLFPLSETIFAGIPATDLLGSLKLRLTTALAPIAQPSAI